jgi:tetratricopeptide (TPR) repeat protein
MRLPESRIGICLAIAILACSPLSAQDYEVTPADFAAWPEYCRARFVTVPWGSTYQWSATYPRATIEAQKDLLGPATFERVHHYCAGLLWLSKSKLESAAQQRQFALQKAQEEILFTYRGLPPGSIIIPLSLVALGQVCMERNEPACAIDNLSQAVTIDPKNPSAYSALAIAYRQDKKLNLARDTLLKGDRATEGKSAEIHYNLGLIYLELGDADRALEQAHAAYGLGYPLPGLRNRLQRMGKWHPPAAAQ